MKSTTPESKWQEVPGEGNRALKRAGRVADNIRAMQTKTLSGAWESRQAGTEKWLPARVPGGAHIDLLALGLIPDPFAGDNEKRVQWVAEADWEYRHVFSCPPELLKEEKVFLVCDGLDTLAAVKLN